MSQKILLPKDLGELQKAVVTLKRRVKRFGPRCSSFTWGCFVCHAYFVQEVFEDFVEDEIATEKWHNRRENKTAKVGVLNKKHNRAGKL